MHSPQLTLHCKSGPYVKKIFKKSELDNEEFNKLKNRNIVRIIRKQEQNMEN